jgi:alpha-tubulin suppressor-like RCC1 family protein/tRNA A-37 threonylcarbamoyl transferase component Bud32
MTGTPVDEDFFDLEDEYEIVGELGRGGSAIVYHGRDRVLGRDVAIKVVRPRFAGPNDEGIARLAREARTVAQLQHRNIVTVHAVKRLRDEGLALVMQYVPGRTLKQAVVEDGAFNTEQAERVIRDVAEALAYAHAHGVVHRDVKPENIFLEASSGRAMLSDFGIAHSAEFDSRLTMTGTAIGTPAYMAPEQIDGAAASPRSDVYSLGLVSWEMLTGHRPWDGESLYNVIYKQKNETLPPIDDYNASVPLRLQYIIERMLQKKPAARWAGADGLLAHLNASVLPADWTQWQEAHKKRRGKRDAPRSKAAELMSAALATIRFQRPPAGVPEGVASATHVSGNVAVDDATPVYAGARASDTAVDDDRPSWVRDAGDARSRARRPIMAAAVALCVVAGGAIAMYATARDGDDTSADAVPALNDVATIQVPTGIRTDSMQGASPDSLAGMLAADSLTNSRSFAADSAVAAYADSIAALSAALRASQKQPDVVYAMPLNRSQPATSRDVAQRTADSARGASSSPPVNAASTTPPAVVSPGESGSGDNGVAIRLTEDRGVVAAGGRHTCTLSSGTLLCWGANDDGQLGDGNVDARPTPSGVVGDIDVVQVSAGISHSCAVTRGGDAYCWGADDSGQLGDATTTSRSAPVRVAGNFSFRMVKAGRNHSCGLTTNGEVACWGSNSSGQLGDGSSGNRSTPTRAASSARFVTVSTGWSHSCALDTQGVAYCWGDNASGQLGDGTRSNKRTPQPVADDLRFTSIAAGSAHTCAVSVTGEVWCWGRNNLGQLGNGSTTDRATPSRVETSVRFTSVSAGSVHNCARTQAGSVFCWGRNSYGQLGDGTVTDRVRPVRVTGGLSFAAVNATGAHTCGISTDGEAVCWGYNVDGQLGDGTRNHRSRPGRVAGTTR